MSYVVDLNLDKDEIELTMEESAAVHKIEYNKIVRLKFSQELVTRWFRKQSFKTIEVYVKGRESPFIISSGRLKEFSQMEPFLQQMAVKHNVPIERE